MTYKINSVHRSRKDVLLINFFSDSSLFVTIEGDEDEAKLTNSQDRVQESDSDAETASENVIEEAPVHKKRHHRMSKEARQQEKKLKLLQRHPLSVKIVLIFKSILNIISFNL